MKNTTEGGFFMKYIKKLLGVSVILVLLVGALVVPSSAMSSSIVASGYCGGEGDGKNLTWELTEDGVLTISGEGAMADWEYSNYVPWWSYRKDIKAVVIPNSVTSIGKYAFFYCDSLTSITIPNSVTTIGENAFMNCIGLTEVIIPDSVTSIGLRVFTYCDNLISITVDENNPNYSSDSFGVLFNKDKTILLEAPGAISSAYTIPDSVTTIGEWAFYWRTSLASVTIPSSVTTIGDGAFSHCKSFTSVTIPNSITTISDSAFNGCYNLTSVTIPDSVTTLGVSAFAFCESLTEISIPDSVTAIGKWAFNGCKGLASVTIPDSVTSIGEYTFYLCRGLTSVTIPASVTTIGECAFRECDSLTEVTIPVFVTAIDDSAFAYCKNLKKIYFNGDAPAFGEEVFCNVTATAYYPAGNKTWTDEVVQDYGGGITWTAVEPPMGLICKCADGVVNTHLTYDADGVSQATIIAAFSDCNGKLIRTEMTADSTVDGKLATTVELDKEELHDIGQVSVFAVDGTVMIPLFEHWSKALGPEAV